MLSLGQLCDNGYNVLLNKQKMYAIKDKEVVIEGEWNQHDGLGDIILLSHHNNKTSVQTNNYTTVASNASLYEENHKYKRPQFLSMTVPRPACAQQSLASFIQEIGAMNLLMDENQYNNSIKQLQEDSLKQLANVITRQDKTKAGFLGYLHGACFHQFSPYFLKQ